MPDDDVDVQVEVAHGERRDDRVDAGVVRRRERERERGDQKEQQQI